MKRLTIQLVIVGLAFAAGAVLVSQRQAARYAHTIELQRAAWDAEKAELTQKLNVAEGDIIFFAAAPWEKACAILGRLRLESAALLQKRGRLSIRADDWKFLWVIDFPLMSYDEAENRYVATHHPFTAPVLEDAPLLDSNPKAVRGQHYDVVLNGMELGGGSIRIHQPALQKKVFEEVLKIPADVVESRFGYMLKAFTYGAPMIVLRSSM